MSEQERERWQQAQDLLADWRRKLHQSCQDISRGIQEGLSGEPSQKKRNQAGVVMEDLIASIDVKMETEYKTIRVCDAERARLQQTGCQIHSSYDTVTRHDFYFVHLTQVCRVETLRVISNQEALRANTLVLGPPQTQYTWRTLGTLLNLFVGMAMPVERIAKMFGLSSSSAYFKIFYQTATHLVPVYIALGKQLANVSHVSVDDGVTRVLENAAETKKTELDEAPAGQTQDPLLAAVDEFLPAPSVTKKSSKAKKTSRTLVSLLHARSQQTEPKSHIFWFVSHQFSMRHVLNCLLKWRSPELTALTLQGDMSSQVQISQQHVEKLTEFIRSGCAAHARRPFWRHRKQGSIFYREMLDLFAAIYEVEFRLTAHQANASQRVQGRIQFAEPIWRQIKQRAEDCLNDSRQDGNRARSDDPLIAACRYILKHYQALTAYLIDPHLSPDNNLCERILRAEKMLLVSSKFRRTRRGRVVLDVLRSIAQTARAAGVNLADYIRWTYEAGQQLQQRAEAFTPYAYHQYLQQQAETT